MSAGPFFIPDRRLRRARSRHGLDDVAELVEYLADLTFTHNQWWAERQCIADGAEQDVLLEEAKLERVHAAFADGVGLAGEIDADHKADRADVQHVRQVLEA